MSLLSVKEIWKEYGDNVILERVNAEVETGEFITIVGASGRGKTTFLKMLLGTERPSRGQLLLDGKPIAHEPGPDRGIVFQRYSVFPHLTVLENVVISVELMRCKFSGMLWGEKRKAEEKAAKQILEQVGLQHALMKYPFELSGGMQQRLAIAQSLVNKPRVLLLDEPFGALDPGIRKDMHALILRLWKETGTTIFMVTHDIREGFYLGTRLWVFDKHRMDPHAPNAFGAKITFDIPLGHCDDSTYSEIVTNIKLPLGEHSE